jgi:hypothetical protein
VSHTDSDGQSPDIAEIPNIGTPFPVPTSALSSEFKGPPGFTRELPACPENNNENPKSKYILQSKKRRKTYDKGYITLSKKMDEMYRRCGAWFIMYVRR